MSNNTCNPCWCLGSYTPPKDKPKTCPKGDCLSLGYILVKPEDSVGPCGQTGNVDLKCYDFSPCCEDCVPNLQVIHNSAPDKLEVISIDKDKLVFKTTDKAEAYDKIVLTIKGECCKLGDFGQITIFIKDLCECTKCTQDETCDKCTGLCSGLPPEVCISSTNGITIK